MEQIIAQYPNLALWIITSMGGIIATLGGLYWRAMSRQQKAGLVSEDHCHDCHAEWDAKLAAGDERMDVSAEVDAFVVTWLPAMCEALEMKPVDCQAMKKEATALLAKVLNAGREKRGGSHAR